MDATSSTTARISSNVSTQLYACPEYLRLCLSPETHNVCSRKRARPRNLWLASWAANGKLKPDQGRRPFLHPGHIRMGPFWPLHTPAHQHTRAPGPGAGAGGWRGWLTLADGVAAGREQKGVITVHT